MSSPPEVPLLVVEGQKGRVESARLVGCGVVVLILVGSLVGGSYLGHVPWRTLSGGAVNGALRVLFFVGMIGAYVGERFVRPRSGRVVFFQDRIVLVKQTGKSNWLAFGHRIVDHEVRVEWTALRGFDDGHAEHVTLLKKDGSSSFLTVPTLREEDRVAVLKLLDEKGVPRIE